MGRRRAIVLGAVHVLIVLHVMQWLRQGTTVSPVEPSEAMRTLELGELNAGFLFFAIAILSTAIFGRVFCGWGCHLVALQDLCGWLMKRAGIRPRPFRSRLLLFAPLALAIYMFVWPTFRRFLLAPALENLAPGFVPTLRDLSLTPGIGPIASGLAGLVSPPPPFPGFSNHLLTESFWATFPTVWVAIPFLAICGFASVYFLGAKGFCSYGCPYGGFFAPADKIAPARIRVNDACEHCGHCTAVCTSNVRVHEEVREYGMVVDPGCMKCMDCVSTCPNDALSFGFGKPAVAKPEPRTGKFFSKFDLSRPEELGLATVFVLTFFAFRGVYDAVPLLMAMGIAGCSTFLAWTIRRLLRDLSVSWHRFALKREGKIRRGGFVVFALGAFTLLLTLQSGFVRYHRASAENWDRRVAVPAEVVFLESRPPVAPEILSAADEAARHYRLADVAGQGGLGLLPTPEIAVRRAWLHLVENRPSEAGAQLARVAAREGPGATIRFDYARVLALSGDSAAAERELRALIAEDPADPRNHGELARILEGTGDLEGAVAELVVLVNLAPDERLARDRLVALLDRLGRPREADRYR